MTSGIRDGKVPEIHPLRMVEYGVPC